MYFCKICTTLYLIHYVLIHLQISLEVTKLLHLLLLFQSAWKLKEWSKSEWFHYSHSENPRLQRVGWFRRLKQRQEMIAEWGNRGRRRRIQAKEIVLDCNFSTGCGCKAFANWAGAAHHKTLLHQTSFEVWTPRLSQYKRGLYKSSEIGGDTS